MSVIDTPLFRYWHEENERLARDPDRATCAAAARQRYQQTVQKVCPPPAVPNLLLKLDNGADGNLFAAWVAAHNHAYLVKRINALQRLRDHQPCNDEDVWFESWLREDLADNWDRLGEMLNKLSAYCALNDQASDARVLAELAAYAAAQRHYEITLQFTKAADINSHHVNGNPLASQELPVLARVFDKFGVEIRRLAPNAEGKTATVVAKPSNAPDIEQAASGAGAPATQSAQDETLQPMELSIDEAIEIAKCDPSHFRRSVKLGKIESRREGYVLRASFDNWMKGRRSPRTEASPTDGINRPPSRSMYSCPKPNCSHQQDHPGACDECGEIVKFNSEVTARSRTACAPTFSRKPPAAGTP
jgi:hypothetical protein